MRTKLTEYIKRHPFVSFEALQIQMGACQGQPMIDMVLELASLVRNGSIAVSMNINTITKAPLACYEWIGSRNEQEAEFLAGLHASIDPLGQG